MNIERLNVIKDYLDNPPKDRKFGFNMTTWKGIVDDDYPDLLAEKDKNICGTACCIAGLACALWPEERQGDGYEMDAGKILGLDENQGNDLFFGAGVAIRDITVDMAIDTLDRLINTEEVKWEYPEGFVPTETENDIDECDECGEDDE